MEKVFLLDIKRLKKGDVICTTVKKNLVSSAIRTITKSKYSHVLMLYGKSAFIHANSAGVYSYNIQRLLFREKDNIIVLRLKEEYKDKIPLICYYLQLEVGKLYGNVSALNAWLKKSFLKKIEDPNSVQFCSKLIAECFDKAELKITKNKNPEECVPEDIASSFLFEEVKVPLRRANEKELEFIKSEAPQEIQAKIFTKILKDAKEKVDPNINTMSGYIQYILDHPDSDLIMLQIFEENSYKKINDIEMGRNGYRYGSYDNFEKHVSLEDLGSLMGIIKDLIPLRIEEFIGYMNIQAQFKIKYNKESKLYNYLIDFYKSMLMDQLQLQANIKKFIESNKQAYVGSMTQQDH